MSVDLEVEVAINELNELDFMVANGMNTVSVNLVNRCVLATIKVWKIWNAKKAFLGRNQGKNGFERETQIQGLFIVVWRLDIGGIKFCH